MFAQVLDKGFVCLIDSMPPVFSADDSVDWGPGDTTIVRAARVSYGPGTKTLREDKGLIRYLMRNQHTSPFEQVVFTFMVKCPISVARQWQRHRTWSYNEVSTRYSKVEDGEVYLPELSRFKSQDLKNRQGSGLELSETVQQAARNIVASVQFSQTQAYQELLKLGVSRETARGVLSLDTYTQFFGTVNLHNLLHFIELRVDQHAQWEIQQYALAISDMIEHVVPATMSAWREMRLT